MRASHTDLLTLNSSIFRFIHFRLLHKTNLITLINKKSYYPIMKILNRLVVRVSAGFPGGEGGVVISYICYIGMLGQYGSLVSVFPGGG